MRRLACDETGKAVAPGGKEVKLPRMTQFHYFEIWSRRYHDNKVLLAAHRVGEHNKIVFTRDPSMGTDPYYISGRDVKKFKKESNGKIQCYAVDVSALEPLELIADLREVI